MTTPATDANPTLAPLLPGYDPTGHQKNIALQVVSVTQDSTTGVYYGTLAVNASVSLTINSEVTPGATVAPSKTSVVAGKSNDGTPQYQPLPLGAGGRSMIIEGFAGGTGVPVSVVNGNGNGQAIKNNSAPVVPASDWFGPLQIADGTTTSQKAAIDVSGNLSVKVGPALPAGTNLIGAIMRAAVAVYSLASTATTSSSNSGDLTVGPYTEISLDINTTAQTGTNPTIQFFYERKAADGIYYVLWQSAVLTAATNTLSTSIGAGMAYNQSLGSTGRLRWVIGGSATPGYTFSANLTGK